jgi:hypothetical protein
MIPLFAARIEDLRPGDDALVSPSNAPELVMCKSVS